MNSSTNIIAGHPAATTKDFPNATVSLFMLSQTKEENKYDLNQFCTGTVIAKNVILTAGHCLTLIAASYNLTVQEFLQIVVVSFDTQVEAVLDMSNQSRYRQIADFKIHDKYDANNTNRKEVAYYDIALLKLDQNVPDFVVPAKIETDASILTKGLAVTLAGFGFTSLLPLQSAKQLQQVEVSIDNPSLTQTQFSFNVIDGKSSCNGDSGGPAYLKKNTDYVVVGVDSWGYGCKAMDVYTSVPVFADWIKETINHF